MGEQVHAQAVTPSVLGIPCHHPAMSWIVQKLEPVEAVLVVGPEI